MTANWRYPVSSSPTLYSGLRIGALDGQTLCLRCWAANDACFFLLWELGRLQVLYRLISGPAQPDQNYHALETCTEMKNFRVKTENSSKGTEMYIPFHGICLAHNEGDIVASGIIFFLKKHPYGLLLLKRLFQTK